MLQGIGNPIVQGSEINGGTNPLELKACDEIFPNFENREEIISESTYNGFRDYTNRWTHQKFKWLIHIYKCIEEGATWGSPYTDPAVYYAELLNLLACDFRVIAHKYEYNYATNRPSAVAVTNYIQSKALNFGSGSSGTSIILNTQELPINDYYNGLNITWNGVTKAITDYDGSSREATIATPFASNPTTSDEYTIDVFFHCTVFKPYYLEDVQRADVIQIDVESMRPVQVNQIAT